MVQTLQVHGLIDNARTEYIYVLLSVVSKTVLGLSILLGLILK